MYFALKLCENIILSSNIGYTKKMNKEHRGSHVLHFKIENLVSANRIETKLNRTRLFGYDHHQNNKI